MKASQLYLFQETTSKNLCIRGSGETDLFLTVHKRSAEIAVCIISSQEQSKRTKTKNKAQAEGKLLQPIRPGLLKYVALDQQRNVLLKSVYQGTLDWKNGTRVLCACCKEAYVVFTMQDSSSQPVGHRISCSLGIIWKNLWNTTETGKPVISRLQLLQRCSLLHWKVLGTCSSNKGCKSVV